MQNQTIELTKIKGSYVNQLEQRNTEIENSYYDQSVTTQEFKQVVKNIVLETNTKSVEKKSVATKRFLESLERQRTKDGIIMLVWNARLKGDGLGVN